MTCGNPLRHHDFRNPKNFRFFGGRYHQLVGSVAWRPFRAATPPPVGRKPALWRNDGEEVPLAWYAFKFVSAALLKLQS